MRTVIIGLGNLMASDDAVGIQVARSLAARELPPSVRVVEGVTAGLDLIPMLMDADRALVVDAVFSGAAPGTLLRLKEQELLSNTAPPLSAHDLALAETLELGRLLYPERMPREVVLFGVEVESVEPYREGLSETVAASVPKAVERILAEVVEESFP